MKSIFWLSFLALFIACNKVTEPNIKELHKKYMTASVNHDIKTLSLMTHDSIVWRLGPFLLKGKEAALGPNKYDKGTDCILDYSNVKVHGDTVEFELVEKNEILSSMGMEGATHYPRFIFKNGLLYKKKSWKP